MVQREFEAIGGDISMLRFNEGAQTGFLDKSGVIQIRGDIFPHPEALNHPRSVMSPRAVLAHEYYGHAAYRGTKLAPGAWNDEFRASYRAALDAPGLSEIDQQHLMLDAIERAREARVRIKRNQFIIGIIGEY